MTTSWKRLIALVAAFSLGAAACSSGGDGTAGRGETSQPLEFELVSSLRSFDACDDLLAHLRAEGLERVGPYGLAGEGFFGGPVFNEGAVDAVAETRDVDTAQASDASGDVSLTANESAGGGAVQGEDFSGTNTQEIGVDEPDLVKTDGEHMYVLTTDPVAGRSVLHVLDVSASVPEETGSLALESGWNHQMFLADGRVIVMGESDVSSTTGPSPVEKSDLIDGQYVPLIVIQEIDVTDTSNPTIASTLRTEGRYLSARSVGSLARIVVQFDPAAFDFVYPSGPGRGEDTAEKANRLVIQDSTLEQWLPKFALDSGQGVTEGQLAECDQIHAPAEFAGFGSLTVLTIDLAAGLTPGNGVSVLADGETVYASADNLYVATNRFVDAETVATDDVSEPVPAETSPEPVGAASAPVENQPIPVEPDQPIGGPVPPFEEPDFDYTTQIHKFAIAPDGPATYEASGSIPGHVLNQYSLSEHEGDLRIATTDGAPWSANDQSSSTVSVLRQEGEELKVIGSVGDLGKGERIFAVRFMGDTGYVVTFRQTDPLYTLDLSDPTNPRAVGELKIEGYSAYLHPIGDNLLLGVGQDATAEGRTTGTQVSLFDVSDPANPTRTQQFTIGDGDEFGGSNSEIEWDARAFLYWPETGLAMIPFEQWNWGPDTTSEFEAMSNGAIGLRIDEQTGITEIGRVTHQRGTPPNEPNYNNGEEWNEEFEIDMMRWFDSRIRRSVVVSDTVYTVSNQSVLGSNIDTLTETAFIDLL